MATGPGSDRLIPGATEPPSAEQVTPTALGRCIGVPDSTFVARYWGKRPLLTRGTGGTQIRQTGVANSIGIRSAEAEDAVLEMEDAVLEIDTVERLGPASFDDLMNLASVDELVSRRGLRTPFARMAKDGSVLSARSFTSSGGTGAQITDQLADDKILSQLADGATLVLQGLHRTWPPLIDFASALMAELGHPAQINAYITPAGNRGFAPHYDTHDVFVLQIAGRKRWRVHEPVLRGPLPEQTWEQRRDEVAARATEAPILDTVLAPGDSLYLPRGYLHAATANDEICVHLTVGVHPLTAATLLSALLTSATAPSALRRSLPAGLDLADPATLAPVLADAVSALSSYLAELSSSDCAAVADMVAAQLRRAVRPAPVSPLAQLQLMEQLTPHTALCRRPGLQLSRRRDEDRIVLHWADRQLSLPAKAAAALQTALSGKTFRPVDLALDCEDHMVIIRRLLREALVVAAGSGSD